MKITTELKNIRVTPRKIRLVAETIKGETATSALHRLRFMQKAASKYLSAAIKTAQADGAAVHKMDPEKLKVSEILVMDGVTLKRGRPVARGSMHAILKRTSHIKVTLED